MPTFLPRAHLYKFWYCKNAIAKKESGQVTLKMEIIIGMVMKV